MPITPPTAGDLASIAERYGLHPRPGDLNSFRRLASGLLGSYDEAAALVACVRPWLHNCGDVAWIVVRLLLRVVAG